MDPEVDIIDEEADDPTRVYPKEWLDYLKYGAPVAHRTTRVELLVDSGLASKNIKEILNNIEYVHFLAKSDIVPKKLAIIYIQVHRNGYLTSAQYKSQFVQMVRESKHDIYSNYPPMFLEGMYDSIHRNSGNQIKIKESDNRKYVLFDLQNGIDFNVYAPMSQELIKSTISEMSFTNRTFIHNLFITLFKDDDNIRKLYKLCGHVLFDNNTYGKGVIEMASNDHNLKIILKLNEMYPQSNHVLSSLMNRAMKFRNIMLEVLKDKFYYKSGSAKGTEFGYTKFTHKKIQDYIREIIKKPVTDNDDYNVIIKFMNIFKYWYIERSTFNFEGDVHLMGDVNSFIFYINRLVDGERLSLKPDDGTVRQYLGKDKAIIKAMALKKTKSTKSTKASAKTKVSKAKTTRVAKTTAKRGLLTIQESDSRMMNGGGRPPKDCKKTGIKKEINGKARCIYKVPGSNKLYIKYKGKLITIKEYKENQKIKSQKQKAKKAAKEAKAKKVAKAKAAKAKEVKAKKAAKAAKKAAKGRK